MRKVINLCLVAFALFALASCGQKSDCLDCGSSDNQAVNADSIARAADQMIEDSIEANQPKTYVFHPAKIETTEPMENKKDKLGEGEDPAHTFSVKVYFIDSVGNEFCTEISGQMYTEKGAIDGQDDTPDRLNKAKTAYAEIINSKVDQKELTVIISADKRGIDVYKRKEIAQKKIGNATVRIAPNPPIWQGTIYFY